MGKLVRTEFGTVLRRFRLKCGLTQQAVADALHVHRATYSYYESGKTLPDFQQLGRIAKVFGVSRETLFRLPGTPGTVSRLAAPPTGAEEGC